MKGLYPVHVLDDGFLGWRTLLPLATIAFVEAHPLNQYQLAFLEAPTTRRHGKHLCFESPVFLGVWQTIIFGGQVTKMVEKFRLCEVRDFVTKTSYNDNRSTWTNG